MSPRRMLKVPAIALLAAGLIASPVLAAGFDPPMSLRTAPAGTDLRVGDIAADGSTVVVGWQEDPASGSRRVLLRWSTDGGTSFEPRLRLDDRPQREVQVDSCRGWVWAVSGLHDPAAPASEWLVVLDGRSLTGAGHEQAAVTTAGLARHPDVACAGDRRLAIAWLQRVGGSYHVKFASRGVLADPLGEGPPEFGPVDLGTATLDDGLAVAATSERVYIAWFDGDLLKVKRYALGSAPDYLLTPGPTQTLADLRYGSDPELGAYGDRVVLAYTSRADLVAQVSLDQGASWGPRHRLLDVPFPSEVGAWATNADIRGTKLLVSGVVTGGIETLSGEGFLYRSETDGESWVRVTGSRKEGGVAVGALSRRDGVTKMVEAWDESIDDPAVQDLRFQRQG